MIHYSDLTPLGRIVAGVVATAGIVAAMCIAGAIETQANPIVATDTQCDSMYHAELVSRGTAAHDGIVSSIIDSKCPW
jgi:hypothetical protein